MAGLVFQFPERHFLGDSLLRELTFGWPQGAEGWAERQRLSERLMKVCAAALIILYEAPKEAPKTRIKHTALLI